MAELPQPSYGAILDGLDVVGLIRAELDATLPAPFDREGYPPQASRAARATLYRLAGRMAEWFEANGLPEQAKPLRDLEAEAWVDG